METIDQSTATQLKQFIERIERLEEEKTALGQDVREVFSEAKSFGFDTKTMRELLKIRKLNADERMEKEHLLDTYLHALGMASAADVPEAA
ncbi:MAG: DUF2312 domain-containing protein [Alphaproteobacteria bacterium]